MGDCTGAGLLLLAMLFIAGLTLLFSLVIFSVRRIINRNEYVLPAKERMVFRLSRAFFAVVVVLIMVTIGTGMVIVGSLAILGMLYMLVYVRNGDPQNNLPLFDRVVVSLAFMSIVFILYLIVMGFDFVMGFGFYPWVDRCDGSFLDYIAPTLVSIIGGLWYIKRT